MLRALWLTAQNEARLLVKDPIVLFMLLFAPVVIITVAGYSLGSLYGGVANSFRLPVVNLDNGQVSDGIIQALHQERNLTLEMLDDPAEARRRVSQRDRTPIAMVIAAGTSAAVAAGRQPRLILFVDPVRRVEVNAIELRIGELCRRVTDQARATAQTQIESFAASGAPTLPGDLGFVEQPAIEGEAVAVNAFDQYVPGFGITFLLIGMMLGIALTLFDERDWGTLKRLQVSGAPVTGLLLGKLFARFIVGIVQMVLLFAVGWALFGITLGRNPLALLIPTVGISFAAAALGLVVASISRAHDSVMPLGVTVSMAMAAIGGCWWPLDFEPGWMRELARWMPTTWTMQAFNDLMIRNQPPSAALWPLAATVGIGTIFLGAGIIRFVSLND
ncbi:ABC transporter permease [Candidatus Binatus sp.]|uniref:ABC transporter permease n=1 Tax=Candidatus Binatus sp. TaxID=2811406 RepID=UPI002F949E9E